MQLLSNSKTIQRGMVCVLLIVLVVVLVLKHRRWQEGRYSKEPYIDQQKISIVSDDQSKSAIAESLILVADTGDIQPSVLQLLEFHASLLPENTTILFLGDNIYPIGMPPLNHPLRKEAEEMLSRQLEMIKRVGIKAVFVPGNHDWDHNGDDGWNAIMRQQQMVEEALGEGSFLPRNGCPGPVEIVRTKNFYLVALDSHWWLYSGKKPNPSNSNCEARTEDEVVARLEQFLVDPPDGAAVLVASHHPLKSFGEHYFGSGCPHDFICKDFFRFRRRIADSLRNSPPLAYIAAHDHTLQVIEGDGEVKYHLISGATSYTHRVAAGDGTLFAYRNFGIMRLDRMTDERNRLSIIVPTVQDKAGKELVVMLLEAP